MWGILKRVVRIVAKWVEHFWSDFDSNPNFLSELKDFTLNTLRHTDESIKVALLNLIKEKVRILSNK